VLFTLYADVYAVIVAVTVIFLFCSYVMPIAAGFFAYGRTWTRMGPWNLGDGFRVVSALGFCAFVLIFFLGIQPPSEKALWAVLGLSAVLAVIWFAFERNRFVGPPTGADIERRQAEIRQAEQALSSSGDRA
jgi:amino acid transporter